MGDTLSNEFDHPNVRPILAYGGDETFEECLECYNILLDTDDEDPMGKLCNECYAFEIDALWEYIYYDE